MSNNLAMAREGSSWIESEVDLSWPLNGQRQVIELAPDDRPERLKMAIVAGRVVEVDDPVTEKVPGLVARVPVILEGEEARAVHDEPAGPVVRTVHVPASPTQARLVGQPIVEVEIPVLEPQIAHPKIVGSREGEAVEMAELSIPVLQPAPKEPPPAEPVRRTRKTK